MKSVDEIVSAMNGANTATQAVRLAIGYLQKNPRLIQNAAFMKALKSALAGTDGHELQYQREVLAAIPEEQHTLVLFY